MERVKSEQNHRYCQLCLINGVTCVHFGLKKCKVSKLAKQMASNCVHQKCVTGKKFILHKALARNTGSVVCTFIGLAYSTSLFISVHTSWLNIEGCSDHAVEHRTVNRGDGGSIPPTSVSKLRQFHSPHICLCLSEETLKAGGPFYLVSMPGEVKDPTQ